MSIHKFCSKEIHLGAAPFSWKDSECFQVSMNVCTTFRRRSASRNSSKGQEETVHDGSCDCQPFLDTFNFACLPPQARSKVFDYFISIEQCTGRVQVQNPVFSAIDIIFLVNYVVAWACGSLWRLSVNLPMWYLLEDISSTNRLFY